MPKVLSLFAALSLLFAATAVRAQESDTDTNAIDDTPHLTMTGTASTQVVPDIAEISLGVSMEKPRAADAAAETARIAKGIVEAAKAQGIDAKDIQTQTVSLTQVFDTVTDASGHYTGQKPRGFSASNTIAIRVRALDKAGALAQTLIEKGANQFNGISFSVEHPEAVKDKLLADAVRDAKRKASIAAGAIGVKLGRVLLIERPQEGGASPVYKSRLMAAAPLAAPAPMPVEAGTQTMSQEMDVTWALEP